jgi:2-polyprenyl-3-methyl-5-hydroxy-6-metoxy-1,4-benzoquinol methylase
MGCAAYRGGIAPWAPSELARREACPLCESVASALIAERSDGLRLRECAGCESLFVDPAPNDAALARCYDGDYYNGRSHERCRIGYETPRHGGGAAALGYEEIAAGFEISGKSILEIGCSDGALLARLRTHDPARLAGVDISEDAIARGRAAYNLDLRCGTLEGTGLAAERFDLVVMIDVIEHLREPRAFFAAAARCVRRGGAMFITTPNASSFWHARRCWPYLDRALEHVIYFSASGIGLLASMNGLAVEHLWTEGIPAGLSSYRRPAAPRPLRMAAEPLTTLFNGWRRWKFRNAAAGGYGLELRALLRRE